VSGWFSGSGFNRLLHWRVSGKTGTGKPNLLLITLDTTRADHLPLYGYNGVQTPHLNQLGQRGVVFEQCATTSPLTLPAHCSILTGYYPPYHGVRVNGNNALSETQTTAAEIFAATGYKTAAFIAAFVSGRPLGVEARV